MATSGAPDGQTDETPEAALQRAEKAIKELEATASNSSPSQRWPDLAVLLVCTVTLGLLATHTFYEKDAPKVDSTTGLLLAVLLFAPFVRHLKALELGGAKAEFRHSTATGLSGVVQALKVVNNAIERIYRDMSEQAAGAEPVEAADQPFDEPGLTRPLRKILWIDFDAGQTTYERNDFSKLFDVVAVSNKADALATLQTDDIDAVVIALPSPGFDITSIVDLSAPRPVIIYTTPEAPAAQPGAQVVTSYSELIKTVRRLARGKFDELVLRQLAKASEKITHNPDGIDYIVELPDGKRVAVETPHWLRTPKAESLAARFHKLAAAVRDGEVAGALLVTQIPGRTQWRSESVARPDNVQLVDLDELGEKVKQFGRPH